jgi:membrane-bound lytic murein transglycosylase MltF
MSSLVWRLAFAMVAFVAISRAGAQSADSLLARVSNSFESAAQARADKRMSDRFDPVFRKYTKRFFGPAFDWKYFKAQGFAESGLKPNAKSWVGARGVMQLMPSTYQQIASHHPEFGAIDQPEWNIAAGIMHDHYLWELWAKAIPDDERHHFMFASYNAGEGTINRALAVAKTKVGPPAWSSVEQIAPSVQRWRYIETLGYVRRIDSAYSKLTAAPLR